VQGSATAPGVEPEVTRVECAHLTTVVVLAPRGEGSRLHLVEGVHQELLRRLAQRPRVRVWPRVDAVEMPNTTYVSLRAASTLTVTIRRDDVETVLDVPLDIASIGLAADTITIAVARVMERTPDLAGDEALESLLLARVLAHRGFEGVEPAYQQLISAHEKYPDDPRIASELAALVLRFAWTGRNIPYDFHTATRLVEAALTGAPHLAEAHVAAGHLQLHTGDAVLAAREFRTAISCSPYLAEPHEGLGRMLLEAGFLDDAVARIDDALAIAPELASVRWEIARAHALEQNWLAHDQVVASLRNAGDRPIARFRFGLWRGDRERMIEARAAWAGFAGARDAVVGDGVLVDSRRSVKTHRDELIACVMTSNSPSKRRIAFSRIVRDREVAGDTGPV
jgi:tetratricopeptide (TPR) repeat protein